MYQYSQRLIEEVSAWQGIESFLHRLHVCVSKLEADAPLWYRYYLTTVCGDIVYLVKSVRNFGVVRSVIWWWQWWWRWIIAHSWISVPYVMIRRRIVFSLLLEQLSVDKVFVWTAIGLLSLSRVATIASYWQKIESNFSPFLSRRWWEVCERRFSCDGRYITYQ